MSTSWQTRPKLDPHAEAVSMHAAVFRDALLTRTYIKELRAGPIFGRFWGGFWPILGRFLANAGPGAVTNGSGSNHATYINEPHKTVINNPPIRPASPVSGLNRFVCVSKSN